MGMQSFRGAGGGGAFSTPIARIDSDPFGEYELAPLEIHVDYYAQKLDVNIVVGGERHV